MSKFLLQAVSRGGDGEAKQWQPARPTVAALWDAVMELAVDAVFFDLAVEGGAADAEELGGFGDIAVGALEGFADEAAFPMIESERFHFVG